ncbi:CRISPR-associated helicase/endonuclease Cas3 [Pseudanabaena sp. PCC 6802]|uniref:CRISPR-associated helicase/endonuclease Cas3 n=1 Tax=Pseudanabaena sp. PCC 6802 TaxID=118173 RepID=UPI0003499C56|nr:CRISPR-associated helicase/endonuclease Cas3 [Pseudanabaena sp. PCC 6802]
MFERLLAKSTNSVTCTSATFTGHIWAVYKSTKTIIAEIGDRIFQQLGLAAEDRKRFERTVELAAYLHDWGKANQHFQEMVYLKSKGLAHVDLTKGKKSWRSHGQRQMIRHEVLSGILALQVPEFREWLSQIPDADLIVAVWAAMGHHLKLDANKIDGFPNGTGASLKVFTSHEDFELVTKKMGVKYLGLPASVPTVPTRDWSREELERAIANLTKEFGSLEKRNEYEQRFIATVKATVIAADLAGSALTEQGEDIKTWIPKMLKLVLEPGDLHNVLQEKLGDRKLRSFQEEIANTNHRVTLVKAGCGTGKTIAAYAWAQKWATGNSNQSARKLFFCYPTTGTATQGFIDYANGSDTESALMHSRSDLDRELLFSGEQDDSESIDARLSSLQAWTKKIVVCTVDTVLGLMQNNRRPLYAFPALMQAAFVFDEVHAYDDRLFGALLKFLKTCRGAPILLMSASFSEEQKEAIQNIIEEDLNEGINILDKGYQPLEEIKRYKFDYRPDIDSKIENLQPLFEAVTQALERGEKVLWVTNSVQSCIDIYRKAKEYIAKLDDPNIKHLIYHSRFRYRDRAGYIDKKGVKQLGKHEQVIQAFDSAVPCLVITTQVCEMSLDLSADLLVTAMAPAAALIQRLGRLNRKLEEYAPEQFRVEKICTAIFYAWDGMPYTNEEMRTGIRLVEALNDYDAISQEDLASTAKEIALPIPKKEDISSAWLELDWENYPVPLREGGGTITVLLEDDMAAIKEASQANQKSFMQETQAWSVPIRLVKGWETWKRCKFYLRAPGDAVQYSEEMGAEPCRH